MRHPWIVGVVAGLAFVVSSQAAVAQDARSVLGEASRALGVEGLNTVEYTASGFDFAFGQAYNPNSPWPKFINKSYTRVVDFRTPASKVDRVRMQGENPPRGGGQQPVIGEQPQSQTIIVNADDTRGCSSSRSGCCRTGSSGLRKRTTPR